MAINFPGPYLVDLRYTVEGSTHHAQYNCDVVGTPAPGTDPDDIDLITRGGTITPMLSAAMASWVTLLAPFYNTAVTFDGYDLYIVAPMSHDKTWIAAGTLVTIGTSANPSIIDGQWILTYRSIEGGGLKINLMQTIFAQAIGAPQSGFSGDAAAFRDFVVSSANWVLARDTSYPIAALNSMPDLNEALSKKRLGK